VTGVSAPRAKAAVRLPERLRVSAVVAGILVRMCNMAVGA
jgi:hypothetical protein